MNAKDIDKWGYKFEQLENALDRLDEVLARDIEEDDIVLEATIQRFEFTFELTWKTMKKVLQFEEKIEVPSPRKVFQQAYLLKWIEDEQLWIDMLDARNILSHVYEEKKVKEIYNQIGDFYIELRKLFVLLKKEYYDN